MLSWTTVNFSKGWGGKSLALPGAGSTCFAAVKPLRGEKNVWAFLCFLRGVIVQREMFRRGVSWRSASTRSEAMSLSTVRGVLVGSRAKGSTRLVLVILATFANGGGICYPAVGTIAQLANVSTRQVQHDLKDLVAAGELTVVAVGGGRNRTTRYKITPKPCSPNQMTERVKSMKGVSGKSGGNGVQRETPNTSSPEGGRGHGAGRTVPSLSLYEEEERKIIGLYHAILATPGSGWLPITMYTDAVRKVLKYRSFEEWREFFEQARNEPEEWPERGTLVRLHWNAY